MSSGRAPECWLHGVHLPPKASWPQEWRGDFAPGSEDFLMESAERRYRLENVLQRAASGQTLTARSRTSSRYGDFSGLHKPTEQQPISLSKAGITWEADGNSSLLIPLLLSDVMFAPVNSNLVFPFSRSPEATHVILIAPRVSGKSAVWLLCTNAGDSDYSLDHLIMSFSRRGAVRWDVRQCHHFSANSCGQGGHGTIFGGVSLLPLYDAHRKLIPLKGDVLNMNKVHNFGRVAVKIWDKLDSGMVRREVDFLQQSAGHPNISALLGIYAEAQKKKSSVVWLLVMEHCTGGDFFDIIKEKYLSIARILDIQAGLASALTHLHRLRIVHRDVKAENVVMHKEHAVLIDFGIAAYLDDQEAMCRPVGSPGYAAPEIIAPTPRLYDELVDVFALGVLSYFMLFRALPFWAGTHEEMLEKTRQCEVEIPELDDDSMRPVVSLVLRMMSKQAADRPSAVACFNELREMAPEVTKSRKASRAFRIAHTALVRYGYMEATGDISLDEFSDNEGADRSEVPSPTNNIDVSPVPTLRTPAAPTQTVASVTSRTSMLSGVGSVLSSARRRMPSLRVPRVGQTVSKVFRNMAHLSEASMSTAAKPSQRNPSRSRQSSGEKAKENESAVVTSRQSGHCFEDMDGLGVLPSLAKHEQAAEDGGPQQEDSNFRQNLFVHPVTGPVPIDCMILVLKKYKEIHWRCFVLPRFVGCWRFVLHAVVRLASLRFCPSASWRMHEKPQSQC
ncbi:mlkA [Symbiodinium sp. KB8]|nr:mlkA [Symbiodinium sp. KB8]